MPSLGAANKLTEKLMADVPQPEPKKAIVAAGNVAVFCRFRPLNAKERAMGEV